MYPGGDGKVRRVDVRTAKGIFCRPIQRLHKLEVCVSPDVDNSFAEPAEDSLTKDGAQQIEPVSI